MHLVLPPDLAADLVTQGWGRPHMWAGSRLSPGFVMVFGPRDEAELAIVLGVGLEALDGCSLSQDCKLMSILALPSSDIGIVLLLVLFCCVFELLSVRLTESSPGCTTKLADLSCRCFWIGIAECRPILSQPEEVGAQRLGRVAWRKTLW